MIKDAEEGEDISLPVFPTDVCSAPLLAVARLGTSDSTLSSMLILKYSLTPYERKGGKNKLPTFPSVFDRGGSSQGKSLEMGKAPPPSSYSQEGCHHLSAGKAFKKKQE